MKNIGKYDGYNLKQDMKRFQKGLEWYGLYDENIFKDRMK